MVKRLASTEEVKEAMNDPVDFRTASNTAVFFVVFRLSMYIICFVASMTAVIMLAVENGDLKEQLLDFSSVTPAGTKTWWTEKGASLDSLCSFEYFAIARKNSDGNDVTCALVSEVKAKNDRGTATAPGLIASSETTLRCNMVKGTLVVGTIYGFLMTVITGLLIWGKKVKVSRSILVELVMAGLLMVMYLATACLVTVKVGESCNACIDKQDFKNKPTCEEFAIIKQYILRNAGAEDGSGNPDYREWYKMMSGLKDGMWWGFAGWFVLTWMLWIRFKNARLIAQQSPEFDNTAGTAMEDESGEHKAPAAAPASPAPSHSISDLAPPAAAATPFDAVGEGNPFA